MNCKGGKLMKQGSPLRSIWRLLRSFCIQRHKTFAGALFDSLHLRKG